MWRTACATKSRLTREARLDVADGLRDEAAPDARSAA